MSLITLRLSQDQLFKAGIPTFQPFSVLSLDAEVTDGIERTFALLQRFGTDAIYTFNKEAILRQIDAYAVKIKALETLHDLVEEFCEEAPNAEDTTDA